MPNLTKQQFIAFLGALQEAIATTVKSVVADGEDQSKPEGARVFSTLVAEIDKSKIESWQAAYANAAGKIRSYCVGYGGMKRPDNKKLLTGVIQPKITFTVDGYLGYSHTKNSDAIFRAETAAIYLELELQKKLNLPNDLQSLLLIVETLEFNHVLIPVGDKNKIHAALGEITVQTQPIQIVS